MSRGGGAGDDRQTAASFALGLGTRLESLRKDLLSNDYEPKPATPFEVRKKNGAGVRTLTVPSVRDRVAQTAAYLAMRQRAENEAEDTSHGYREGRSVATAIDAVSRLHRQGYNWIVDADIKAFFDNVPHLNMLAALSDVVPERPFLKLVRKWLEQSRFKGRGLPQGAPISPVLANIYLDAVDETVAANGFRIVRYADDFVILCRSEARAEKALALAAETLRSLELEFNPEKTAIRRLEDGYRFLGRDVSRTTLSRQMAELEDDSGTGEDVAEAQPALNGALAVSAAPLDGVTPESSIRSLRARSEGFDRPWELPDAADTAVDLDDPDPLTGIEVAGASRVSRHAPFIRPLYLLGAGKRLDVWQSGLGVFEKEALIAGIMPGSLDRIDIFPGCEVSADAIRSAAREGIPVFMVNGLGATEAAFMPEGELRSSLHLAQARIALDPALAADLARRFVAGRIQNQRQLLKRSEGRAPIKDEKLSAVFDSRIKKLDRLQAKAARDPGIQSVQDARAIEAWAGRIYWPALSRLLKRGHAETAFIRSRRPAKSAFNALLNWTSSLLRRDFETLCQRRGVHPGFGVLHTVRDTRNGCVFDLIEEFRAPVAEALSANLLSTGALGAAHFETMKIGETEGVWLVNGASAKTLRAYEKHVDHKIKNSKTGEWTTWRGMMDFQVSAYINHVLGHAAYQSYKLDF